VGALSWPEEALRANIIAQVSLALNRIWTEWYPSRGYSFNITGSPGYDQAYVNGRTVFAVMERLTAELFNTFVQRSGDAEPYFTEYCDGKTVTCPGMKQWGTVDRAREGMNALQILRYYYGNRVQLVTTDNIAAIPSSYPGSPLRRGSTGTNVRILQKQLSRIAKDYPSFARRDRHLRRGHREQREEIPEAVQPDGGRRGRQGNVEQSELYLCQRQRPG
jgi:hypothetical protein